MSTRKKATKRKSGAAVRSKDGLGETFKASIKDSLHAALGEVWSEVTAQLKGDVYADFGGYDHAELRVVEGCAGEEWWTSKLSDLVTEFLDDRDGTCGPEESEWCDAIAADLEKQAKRLRKHATKLRSPNVKVSDGRGGHSLDRLVSALAKDVPSGSKPSN